MIFLLEYDRNQGRLIEFTRFSDAERSRAEGLRLQRELDLNRRHVEREVLILEARSEEVLRRTHRRYFETLAGLAKVPA